MATGREVNAAREELARINRELGFPRRDGGSGDPKANETSVADPPAANSNHSSPGGEPAEGSTPKDPGPPRFLGVDLDNKLAGLTGGAIIPISDSAAKGIVDLLLVELRANMDRTLASVAATHANVNQLEIPFGEPDPS